MGLLLLSLEPGDYWMLVSILGAGGVFAFVGAFIFLQRARLMENTPTARIRSAAQGYVELEGQAQLMDGDPIVAPLTKARCCWWRFRIEHRERNRDGKGWHWDTVEQDASDELFHLVDDTGACVVDPQGAKVVPSARQVWYGSSLRPSVGPRIGSGWLRAVSSSYRYTEERLEISTPLYAIGYFRTQTGADGIGSQDAEVRELLAKWKRDPKMVAMLDVDRDGRLDAREWEAARRMAHGQVMREIVMLPPAPDVHILGRPPDRRPFVLSAVSQAELIRRNRLRGGAALGLALAAGALCTYALQLRGFI